MRVQTPFGTLLGPREDVLQRPAAIHNLALRYELKHGTGDAQDLVERIVPNVGR